MGRLISLTDISGKERWYFDDAFYDAYVTPSKYQYAWPSKNYPFAISVHNDILSNRLRIQIRQWIETNVDTTVIFDNVDKSYRHYYNMDEPPVRDNYRDIASSWTRFNFDNELSALAFSLVFSEIVSPITSTHPTWHI